MTDRDEINDAIYEASVEIGEAIYAHYGVSDAIAKHLKKLIRVLQARVQREEDNISPQINLEMSMKLTESEKRITKLKEALRFYADEKNYLLESVNKPETFDRLVNTDVHKDYGTIARKALGEG